MARFAAEALGLLGLQLLEDVHLVVRSLLFEEGFSGPLPVDWRDAPTRDPVAAPAWFVSRIRLPPPRDGAVVAGQQHLGDGPTLRTTAVACELRMFEEPVLEAVVLLRTGRVAENPRNETNASLDHELGPPTSPPASTASPTVTSSNPRASSTRWSTPSKRPHSTITTGAGGPFADASPGSGAFPGRSCKEAAATAPLHTVECGGDHVRLHHLPGAARLRGCRPGSRAY